VQLTLELGTCSLYRHGAGPPGEALVHVRRMDCVRFEPLIEQSPPPQSEPPVASITLLHKPQE
jgi:hypothetical protein